MFMLFLFSDRMYYVCVVSLFQIGCIRFMLFLFSERMYYVYVVSLFT